MSGPLQPLALRPQELAAPAAAANPPKGAAGIHEAATAFEGMLVSQMLQAMRKTVPRSGLLGDSGQARGTLEYLMDQAVVDAAMKGGRTWGLAKRLEASWQARTAPARPAVQGIAPGGR